MSKISSIVKPSRGYPKLTKWKNEPTVDELKQDLTDSETAYSMHNADVQHWLDLMHPKPFDTKKEARSRIQPMLIRKQAEWRYASLSEPFLSNPNIFRVKPLTFEDTFAASQNELVLNNQFNTKLNKVHFIDDLVRTVVNEGTAIVRVGWEYSESTMERLVPMYQPYPYNEQMDANGAIKDSIMKMIELYSDPISRRSIPEEWVEPTKYNAEQQQQINQMIDQLQQMAQQTGQQPDMSQVPEFAPVYPIRVGSMYAEVPNIKNQPTVEVCKYSDVMIDPTCDSDISKAEFIIFKFETCLADLKKDPRYKNVDKIDLDNLDPQDIMEDYNEYTRSFNFKDDARKKFVAYEYWGNWDISKDKTKKPIVATWVGDIMIRCEENPFPDGEVPFVLFRYLPKAGSIYGEPDASLLEDNQRIIGALTRGAVDLLAKSANSQTGIAKGTLDAVNKRRFDLGQDYEFNLNMDPRATIFQHAYPEVPNSVINMLQMQTMEAENITGIKAYGTGSGDPAQNASATQIRGAMDSASKREMGILRRLQEGMVKIARKIIAMNGEFLSEEEILRVTNEEFVTIRRDDLPGNFDLVIDISTNEQEDVKAQELAFMLQTLGQDMDNPMRNLILSEIAKLRKMPELAKRIQNYRPQPDPIMEQIKQAQLENWQLLNEKLKAEIQKLMAESQKIGAEAQTEMADAQLKPYTMQSDLEEKAISNQLKSAQAENLKAKSARDMHDLLMEQNGTRFAQQMQLQGAQAKANLDRDIAKAEIQARLRSMQQRNMGSTNTSTD